MEIRDVRTSSDLSDTTRGRAAGPGAGGTRAGGPSQGVMAARVEQARSVLEKRIESTLAQLEKRIEHAQSKGVDGERLEALVERSRSRFERLAEQATAGLEQSIARLRSTRDTAAPTPTTPDGRVAPATPESLAAQAQRELEARAQGVISALGARIGQATAGAKDPGALTELIAAARKQLSTTLTAARESLEARIQAALGTTAPAAEDSVRAPVADSAEISAAGELLARAEDEGRLDGATLARILELQERYAAGTLNTDALIDASASRLLASE